MRVAALRAELESVKLERAELRERVVSAVARAEAPTRSLRWPAAFVATAGLAAVFAASLVAFAPTPQVSGVSAAPVSVLEVPAEPAPVAVPEPVSTVELAAPPPALESPEPTGERRVRDRAHRHRDIRDPLEADLSSLDEGDEILSDDFLRDAR